MTPEEITALQKENEALKVKANEAGNATERLAALEKSNKEVADRNAALTLDLAKRDTLAKYPNLKGMESHVKGGTPDEFEATAKALSEAMAARETEIKKSLPAPNPADQWAGIPRSVNNSFALPKDRQDEYAAVRADKALPPMAKLTKLMQMHLVDQSRNMITGTKRALGIA